MRYTIWEFDGRCPLDKWKLIARAETLAEGLKTLARLTRENRQTPVLLDLRKDGRTVRLINCKPTGG